MDSLEGGYEPVFVKSKPNITTSPNDVREDIQKINNILDSINQLNNSNTWFSPKTERFENSDGGVFSRVSRKLFRTPHTDIGEGLNHLTRQIKRLKVDLTHLNRNDLSSFEELDTSLKSLGDKIIEAQEKLTNIDSSYTTESKTQEKKLLAQQDSITKRKLELVLKKDILRMKNQQQKGSSRVITQIDNQIANLDEEFRKVDTELEKFQATTEKTKAVHEVVQDNWKLIHTTYKNIMKTSKETFLRGFTESELVELMIQPENATLREQVLLAGDFVFDPVKLFSELGKILTKPETAKKQKEIILNFINQWIKNYAPTHPDFNEIKAIIKPLLSSSTLEASLQPLHNEIFSGILTQEATDISLQYKPRGKKLLSIDSQMEQVRSGEKDNQIAEQLASDLTEITRQIFFKMRPGEFRRGHWNKKPEQAPAIGALTDLFEHLQKWSLNQITTKASSIEERSRMIGFFIQLATICVDQRDFSTAMPIYVALIKSQTTQFKDLWQQIAPLEQRQFLRLKNLLDPNVSSELRKQYKELHSKNMNYSPLISNFLRDLTLAKGAPSSVKVKGKDTPNLGKVESIGRILQVLRSSQENVKTTNTLYTDIHEELDKLKNSE